MRKEIILVTAVITIAVASTCTWDTMDLLCGIRSVTAEPTPLVGDVNGDGRVSVADMVQVDIALGSKPGDPNYNPNADVNGDGRISIADMVEIDIHLGAHSKRFPTASGYYKSSTQVGQNCTFRVKWACGSGLSGYVFGCNVSGSWQNETWTEWSGSPAVAWSNATKTLPSTVGTLVEWQVWANNTEDDWRTTGLENFTVHSTTELYVHSFDNTENTYWYLRGDYPYIDDSETDYIEPEILDPNMRIAWFHFEDPTFTPQQVFLELYGCKMGWKAYSRENETRVQLHDGTSAYNITVQLLAGWATPASYQYNWQSHNTWVSYNVTSILNTTTKITNAKIKLISLFERGTRFIYKVRLRIFTSPVPVEIGVMERRATYNSTFYCEWTDEDGLSTYAFNHNASGNWLAENITGTLSGTTDWSNETVTLPSSSLVSVEFKFWANDTNNEWSAETRKFYVISQMYNESRFNIIGNCSERALMHSLGRSSFWGENSQRYWVFWRYPNLTEGPLGSDQVYMSSTDGMTWVNRTVFRDDGIDGGEFYVHYENRSGHDYIHYQLSGGMFGSPLLYRKGECHSNGTITWFADEQTVVEGQSGVMTAPNGIATTPSGYVFMGWINATTYTFTDMKTWITFSQNTSGYWETYEGYPKQFEYPPDSQGRIESYIFSLGVDDGCYQIINGMGGSEKPWVGKDPVKPIGREIKNHTYQAIENISDMYSEEARYWSAFSDGGDVHFSFRGNDATFYYCWRNGSSGNWDIKDEVISDYMSPGKRDGYSYLVIGLMGSQVYANWFTREDESCWVAVRRSTEWGFRKRIFSLWDYAGVEARYYIQIDPNVLIPESNGNEMLFCFRIVQADIGQRKIGCYLYSGW